MRKKTWRGLALGLSMLALMTGCGNTDTKETGDRATAASTETETEAVTEKTTVAAQEVVTEGMIPVTGDQLKDGTYDISVKSSSSMFDITACQLTVSQGTMTAKMIMGGKGYLFVYPGTIEEAEQAPEGDRISFKEEADGSHSFTFPVKALNQATPCAAFSKKKELWYDRDLCFEASGLPLDAYVEKPYKDAGDLGLSDGEYTAPVTLTGGSGRASVESPAKLTVSGGAVTARIVWSSSKYDYMVVNGEKYLPVENPETENSTFLIPVTGFDFPLPVKADTTAMSEAHEIEYTLTFDSAGIQ